MSHVLEHFVKNILNHSVNYDDTTLKLKSMKNSFGDNIIDENDKVIFIIPNRGKMTNMLIYTTKKLIVGNRGDWDADLDFDYNEFISFRVIQRKFFFKKLDLCITPSYDKDWGGGGSDFYVDKNHANTYKELHCNILTMCYPDTFDTSTDWEKVMSRL